MKQFWKDLWFAVFLGLILPGVILNAAASYTDSSPDSDSVSVPAAALSETMPEGTALPVLVRVGEEVQEEDLDAYLVGVVLGEMPTDFAPEALKAQSVAARTYAWKAYVTGGKHHDGSVCTQSGCCQAYIDPQQYLEQGGSLEGLAKVRQAVAATSGLVLSYQGELIEATYFSCSGGQTEDAVAVWGTDYPYLQSVESPGEEDAVHYEDVLTYSLQQFQDALGIVLSDPPEQWFSQVEYTNLREHRGTVLHRDPAAQPSGAALHPVFHSGLLGYRDHHHQWLWSPGGHEPVRCRCHGRQRQLFPGDSRPLLSRHHTVQRPGIFAGNAPGLLRYRGSGFILSIAKTTKYSPPICTQCHFSEAPRLLN